MIDPEYDDFVQADEAPFYAEAEGSRKVGALLWGDGIKRLDGPAHGRVKVRARDRDGWVAETDLGGQSLLEIYFIDVGQGDGILIKTPDFRHVMIDGGHARKKQNTGKSAADFVDWKFCKDYGLRTIALDAMISSHNDADHYGGLADLLDAQRDDLDADGVTVEQFFHAGVSWWKDGSGERTLGPVQERGGRHYLMRLLEDRTAAEKATDGGSGPQLQGEWAEFIKRVVASRNVAGEPTPIERLGSRSSHLPGFSAADGDVAIRVLGPVEHEVSGQTVIESFSGDSKTTNGNSVLLRVDYGRSRILLTGDLNKESQDALMAFHAGNRLEFQCDVAKCCHHGSEDVSFKFLQAMSAAATVISSGDGEGHDHPRPRIVAASGATGYLTIEDDSIVTPLVYSTELARSVSIGHPYELKIHRPAAGQQETDIVLEARDLQRVEVSFTETKPGALRPRKRTTRLSQTRLVAGLIYGLVNIRTDGEKILAATMNEGDGTFSVKTFKTRF